MKWSLRKFILRNKEESYCTEEKDDLETESP
jgi:hypothetical protein